MCKLWNGKSFASPVYFLHTLANVFFHKRRLELFSRVPTGEIFHLLLKEGKLFERQPAVGSEERIGHCRIFLLSEPLPLGQFERFHSRLVSTSHSVGFVCFLGFAQMVHQVRSVAVGS